MFVMILLCCFPVYAIYEGGEGKDNGKWEIIWEDRIDGQNVSSKKAEYDHLIVIKVVAKARQTELNLKVKADMEI